MPITMKPETIARRAAQRQQEQYHRRQSFERSYLQAKVQFPLLPELGTLDLSATHYWSEFVDGRAVNICADRWREE
jgi:hypothetical protein